MGLVFVQIKAVFFDLFETLITEFSDGKRITARDINYLELFGISSEDFKKEWGSRQEDRMRGRYSNYAMVMKDILDKRKLNFNAEAVESLYQARIREKEAPFQNIRPDVIALLANLRKRGLKLGLISNCTEEEVRLWHKSELAPYFDEVVFSYEVALAKPDIRIYQLACERLGVEPEHAIFIGDGGSNELDGAAQAGLHPFHAFWFNTYIKSSFTKLVNLEKILEELEYTGD
jgi:putative hydrolase of the HAD superfamily